MTSEIKDLSVKLIIARNKGGKCPCKTIQSVSGKDKASKMQNELILPKGLRGIKKAFVVLSKEKETLVKYLDLFNNEK